MSEINQQGSNPLQKYFRQPKLYITLPSNGKFYPNGAYENSESGELPVFSMTARDELTFKTPDALLNGQATVDVIQSCIPNIKNAWLMPSIDLDACLIAIRMATYGETMGITIKQPVTGEDLEMNVDLRGIMDSFAQAQYQDTVQVGEMTVTLRPLTYKEFTKNALKTFEEQRIFNVVNDDSIEDEAKLQAFTNSFVKLTELTVGMLAQGIAAITIGEDVVDNRKHIDEFIANADKQFFNTITEHLQSQKDEFAVKPMTVNSTAEDIEKGVPASYEVPITFDQSNFFG
jgi:hypothetical protein|tara:strand:+ start:1412 stop:2275 length:864 start_codon:yes stop_codon:yes gene_type:complete